MSSVDVGDVSTATAVGSEDKTTGPADSPSKRRSSSSSTSSSQDSATKKRSRSVTQQDETMSAAVAADTPRSAALDDVHGTNGEPSDSPTSAKRAHVDMTARPSTSAEHSTTSPSSPHPHPQSQPPDSNAAAAAETTTPPSAHITIRTLIVTQDASIIIGKAGKNVNEIRQESGAKLTISESLPGNPERIMAVSGPLDAVAKAFGLIVRRINDEPFDTPSVPGSRPVTIRVIVPHSRMGSVIGKGGAKIKEIQEQSGARLHASEQMLPASTERILSVSGVADAIHISIFYLGTVLLEPSSSTAPHQPYKPLGPAAGFYAGPSQQPSPPVIPSTGVAPPPPQVQQQQHQQQQTQHIFIPDGMVGAIIGKGGSRINEMRAQSQCQIKVCPAGEGSPGANPQERLVVITGQPHAIQVAIGMLYKRLEAQRSQQQQPQVVTGNNSSSAGISNGHPHV